MLPCALLNWQAARGYTIDVTSQTSVPALLMIQFVIHVSIVMFATGLLLS